jgi:prepilin-type N-terminal cleavage/methylation domain-containing protein
MKQRFRTRAPRSIAGFTMIEVMVAVLLSAIATSGIIGLYLAATRSSGFSRHTTEATVLAQDGLERLRTQPLAIGTNTVPNLDEHGVVVVGGLFTRQDVVADTTPDFADMTVTVAWTEDGITRQVVLRSRRNK